MRYRFILGIAALALVVTACTAAPAGLTPEDEAAIRGWWAAWDQAALVLDFDAQAGLLTEDAAFMGPNGPSVEGRAACIAWIESGGFTEIRKHDSEVTRVEGKGDLAFAQGTTERFMLVQGIEEPIEDVLKWLSIYRKQADGSWLCAVVSFNSNLPLPE